MKTCPHNAPDPFYCFECFPYGSMNPNNKRPPALPTSSYGVKRYEETPLDVGFDITFKFFEYIMAAVLSPLWLPIYFLGWCAQKLKGRKC